MSPLVQVEDLIVEFDTRDGRRRVVDEVSFSVRSGEVLGVLGESGSGKTVSTMALLGLLSGEPGLVGGRASIKVGESEVDLFAGLSDCLDQTATPYTKDTRRWNRLVRKRMASVWGRQLSAVFQNPRASLDPLMTIGYQVAESVQLAHPAFDSGQVERMTLEWLERVQLDDARRVYHAYPHELSGGMCQRAMIAVALARRPQLLIADEPTTGLDTTVRAGIVRLFEQLIREEQRAMMYISHDIREVLYLSDRVIVMRHGRIVDHGTSEEIKAGGPERAEYTRFLLEATGLSGERT